MPPVVSIILPVLNGENYIHEAIESVLNQTFSDWELLIQDNCSTDRTVAIVRQYCDPRIKLACNDEKLNMPANYNAALSRATGKYVHLFSHDDRMLPENLATQVRFLDDHPSVSFSFCTHYTINDVGQRFQTPYPWDAMYQELPIECPPIKALLLFDKYGCLPRTVSTVMIRNDFLQQIGLFDSTLQMTFDWHLEIRLAHAAGFGIVQERLVEIRYHRNQESMNPDRVYDKIIDTYRSSDLLHGYLPEQLSKKAKSTRRRQRGSNFLYISLKLIQNGNFKQMVKCIKTVATYDGLLVPTLFLIFDQTWYRSSKLLCRKAKSELQVVSTS